MSDYDVDVILRLLPTGVRNAMQYKYMLTLVKLYKDKKKYIDYDHFIKDIIMKSLKQAEENWSQTQLFQKMQQNVHQDLQADPPLAAVYPGNDTPQHDGVSVSSMREGASELSSTRMLDRLQKLEKVNKYWTSRRI